MLVHGSSAALESVAELGPKWFAKGLADFANPTSGPRTSDFVFERSGEMRNRMNEVDRDVREHLREIDLRLMDPTTGALARGTDLMKAHAYQGIADARHGQRAADLDGRLPQGAWRRKRRRQGAGRAGRRLLRRQDGAQRPRRHRREGLGAVQRGPEFFKLFTMFYTFWNHNINRIMDTARMAMEGEHLARQRSLPRRSSCAR
jgi:hypothetical protein